MNHNHYVNVVSNLSVQMPKFDVTRLSDFHEVLKNSVQRFSELCENLRVSSHQILTLELTGWKPRLRNHCSSCNNISICTSKHPPLYVIGDSLSQVRFPSCQFYQSKFDVTRPCNFHKVLKTSVTETFTMNLLQIVKSRQIEF